MEIITAVAVLSAIVNLFMVVIIRDIIHFNSEEVEHSKEVAELWQKSAEKWRTDYDKILQNIIHERTVLFDRLVEKQKSDESF